MSGPCVVFNSRCCGRCGGTGVYHFAVGASSSMGRCYACSGAGRLMSPVTRRHALAFAAWRDEARPTLQQVLDALRSGRFGKSWRLVSAPTSEAA